MRVAWTSKASADLVRLHAFLAPVNQTAAARVVRALVSVPRRLRHSPRLGEQLDEFAPLEVRRVIVGHYELRYEIRDDAIYVLRVWHTREAR